MDTEIMLLTKENRGAYEPCIMGDIWLHMEDNDIFGYGIAEDNNAVGAVVCSYVDGLVNILSLGVSPEYRRRGLARKLLTHLEQMCSANEFVEIQARFFMDAQACMPLEELFASCGYSLTDGDFKQVSFVLGDLVESRIEKQLRKTNEAQTMKKLRTLGELTPEQQEWLLNSVNVEWSEMPRLSLSRSCASLRNGEILGAVLISEENGSLEIVQLYSAADSEAASMLCLFATMGEALDTMPPETMVRFHAADDITNNLTTKLLDNCKIKTTNERIAYRSVALNGETE
ncbi:MAG: GNAT family N-acetyltransferase [Oscillospiraceae bacterium]